MPLIVLTSSAAAMAAEEQVKAKWRRETKRRRRKRNNKQKKSYGAYSLCISCALVWLSARVSPIDFVALEDQKLPHEQQQPQFGPMRKKQLGNHDDRQVLIGRSIKINEPYLMPNGARRHSSRSLGPSDVLNDDVRNAIA